MPELWRDGIDARRSRRADDLADAPGAGLGGAHPRAPRARTTSSPARSSRGRGCGSSTGPSTSAATPGTCGRSRGARTAEIPGDNCAYRRELLGRHARALARRLLGAGGQPRARGRTASGSGTTPTSSSSRGGRPGSARSSASGSSTAARTGGSAARGSVRAGTRPAWRSPVVVPFVLAVADRPRGLLARPLSRTRLVVALPAAPRLRRRLGGRRGCGPCGQPARPMSEPELSVVIASVNGLPYLGECLDALAERVPRGRGRRRRLDRRGDADRGARALAVREAALVRRADGDPRAARGRGLRLRRAGRRADRGPLPRHDRAGRSGSPPATRAGHGVVGGPIRNVVTERLRDWAAFFCEYSAVMEPMPRGPVAGLPGMNVSYDREAIAAIDDLLREGRWENWLHPRLQERGFELWCEPEAVRRARQGLRPRRVRLAALPLLALVRRDAEPRARRDAACSTRSGRRCSSPLALLADGAERVLARPARGASSCSRRR